MRYQKIKNKAQSFYRRIIFVVVMSPVFAYAADYGFQPMSDHDLSDATGQALLSLSYISPTDQGNPNNNIGFYRLGMEADLEINANINKMQLGCGGVNGADGCDIDLDHVRLTGMVDTGTVDAGPTSSFLAKNPFLEFAIKNPDSASTREIAGFRLGFLEAFGKLTIGEPNNYNGQNLSFTKNNDPNTHTGINSLSGDLGLSLVNSYIPLLTCISGANAGRTGCNLGGSIGIPLGNASINADQPNTGDNRFNLAFGRGDSVALQGIKAQYLGFSLNANWVESLKFVHEIALGNDANGNGMYDVGEATQDFVLLSLSSLGDNNVFNNQFTNANNLRWQRVSDPSNWYGAPRGWSLSAPNSVTLGNTETKAVYVGLGEALGALAGFTLDIGNLDAGLRPVDNCFGNLTFC